MIHHKTAEDIEVNTIPPPVRKKYDAVPARTLQKEEVLFMNSRYKQSQVTPLSPNWGPILTIYIALKPLYLSQSGSLQICDIFMVFGLIYLFFSSHGRVCLPVYAKPFIKALLAFTVFVIAINGLWTLTGYSYIKPILYYVFNFFAVIICLCVYQKNGKQVFEQAIFQGVFLSAIIALLGLVINASSGRATGFFNNPNQLGYYGVVIFSLALLPKKNHWNIATWFVLLVGCSCVVLSLSKAAFVSLMVQILLYVIFARNQQSATALVKRGFWLLFFGVVLYLFLFTDVLSGSVFDPLIRMRKRLFSSLNEGDSDFGSGRGYDRIKELGIHFLWGMAEGNYSRFVSLSGLEAHSTYVSVLVSYGLIGFLLYIFFLAIAIFRKNRTLKNCAIASGPLLYGLTHNGIRNTLVWILLVSIYLLGSETEYEKMSTK